MSSEPHVIDRRRFASAALAAGAGLGIAGVQIAPKQMMLGDRRKPVSRVTIVPAAAYSDALEAIILDALRLFRLPLKRKAVVLKPNIVEHAPGAPINTDPVLVGAAATAFLRLGAATVTVAEGPGHVRDTFLLLEESGFRERLADRGIRFVDLNRDVVVKTRVRSGYTGLDHFWLPKTVLAADLVGSSPHSHHNTAPLSISGITAESHPPSRSDGSSEIAPR